MGGMLPTSRISRSQRNVALVTRSHKTGISVLLADSLLPPQLVGSDEVRDPTGEVHEDSLRLVAEALSPTACREPNSAINHASSEAKPSPAQPPR